MKRKRPMPVAQAQQAPLTDVPQEGSARERPALDIARTCLFALLLFLAMTVQTDWMPVFLAAVALLAALPIGKEPLRNLRQHLSLPVLGLLAFALMNGLAAIYSPFGAEALREFYRIFAAVSLALLLLVRFEKKHVRGLLWGFAAVCAVISLLSIDMASDGILFRGFEGFVELLGGTYYANIQQATGIARVTGLYNDPNVTASIFGLGALAALYLTDTAQSRRESLLACELLGVSALGFFLSMSRGAILCFALALLVWLVAAGKENRLRLFVLMLLSALVTVVLSAPAMAAIGRMAIVPLLLALAAGPLVFLLVRGLGGLLAKTLETRKKLAVGLLAGLLACCVAYAVAGVLVTGPYTMGPEGYLKRIVTLEPGDYTLSGGWEGEITLTVLTSSKEDILMGRETRVYQGPIGDAAFTVPEGTEQVTVWFRGPEGVGLEEVTLSDGTRIPLNYPLLPAFIADRIQGSLFSDNSFLLRVQYVKDAWTLFIQSPLLGHGLASTEGLYTSVQPFYYQSLYVHNHILQVMSDMGLLGLAAFLLLLLGSAWLLLRRLRQERDGLAALLLAGWVLMNAHSLMEINFSIRAYQCAALVWLLLPVLLYTRPLARKGLAKWGGLGVMACVWLYLAVFGGLLVGHSMVDKKADNFSATDAYTFLDGIRGFAKRDVFDNEYYKLTFVGNTATLKDSRFTRDTRIFAEDLRESGTYTACSGLAKYYYLPRGEYEELFACSREGIAQEASTAEAWNLQLDFYRTDVLSAMAEEDLSLFLEEVLRTGDYLETYSQGRMEEIQLSEENQAFLEAVATVQETGLEGETALLALTALQASQS